MTTHAWIVLIGFIVLFAVAVVWYVADCGQADFTDPHH